MCIGKTKLRTGARVIVRLNNGNVRLTRTRSVPWQLGHGAWVVLLEDRAGGYDLDRVEVLDGL